MSSFLQKFRKDIAGIVWGALVVFIGAALITYNPNDPSLNSTGRGGAIHNACGYIGSFLSDILFQSFGIGAWALVVVGVFRSIRSFQGRGGSKGWLSIVLAVMALVVFSGLVGLHLPTSKFATGSVPLGGAIGSAMARALSVAFNQVGAAIVLWSAALVMSVYFTQKTVLELFGSVAAPAASLSGIVAGRLKAAAKKNPRDRNEEIEEEPEIRSGLGVEKILWPKTAADRNEEPITGESEPHEEEPKKFPIPFPKMRKKLAQTAERRKTIKPPRHIENWEMPKLELLAEPPKTRDKVDEKLIKRFVGILEEKLAQFSAKGKVVDAKPGPAVTMFEFKPNSDVKISKITELENDLALALSAESLRIIAPIPGRDVVGIETSNPSRETVYLREIMSEPRFWDEDVKLPLALGKQANGDVRVEDLKKMPHLLVAGTTGSGKSVFMTSVLTSLLFRHSPKTLRFIIIDPKQVDFAAFGKIPHLLTPIVKDPKKAVGVLRWAIREMEKRYTSLEKFEVRGIEDFNEAVKKLSSDQIAEHAKINEDLEAAKSRDAYYYQPIPYIVIMIEEFGDLMVVDKVNVEQAVVRLAQMARASGIHLILAMQSPRKEVVTGVIKTNIPGRISFKVASKMDSRIILDESGGERLLARGDMLFLAPGVAKPLRHHAAWLGDDEIAAVTRFWADQGEPEFDKNASKIVEGGASDLGEGTEAGMGDGSDEDAFDEKYDEVLAYVSTQKEISASLLQRRFKLGYPRAARMIEVFEREKVVGPANGSKPRLVLISKL